MLSADSARGRLRARAARSPAPRRGGFAFAAALCAALAAAPAAHCETIYDKPFPDAIVQHPANPAEARAQVEAAARTLREFRADPAQAWLHAHLGDARALLIVPRYVRGGFGFFGGSGGKGVLVVRDGATGKWSMPAFYILAGASVGIEVGVETSQTILLATTPRGVAALSSAPLQLGVGINIAPGPAGGMGVEAANADVLVFERAVGLYGGVALRGAGLFVDDARNTAYYGGHYTPREILAGKAGTGAGGVTLRRALAGD